MIFLIFEEKVRFLVDAKHKYSALPPFRRDVYLISLINGIVIQEISAPVDFSRIVDEIIKTN